MNATTNAVVPWRANGGLAFAVESDASVPTSSAPTTTTSTNPNVRLRRLNVTEWTHQTFHDPDVSAAIDEIDEANLRHVDRGVTFTDDDAGVPPPLFVKYPIVYQSPTHYVLRYTWSPKSTFRLSVKTVDSQFLSDARVMDVAFGGTGLWIKVWRHVELERRRGSGAPTKDRFRQRPARKRVVAPRDSLRCEFDRERKSVKNCVHSFAAAASGKNTVDSQRLSVTDAKLRFLAGKHRYFSNLTRFQVDASDLTRYVMRYAWTLSKAQEIDLRTLKRFVMGTNAWIDDVLFNASGLWLHVVKSPTVDESSEHFVEKTRGPSNKRARDSTNVLARDSTNVLASKKQRFSR